MSVRYADTIPPRAFFTRTARQTTSVSVGDQVQFTSGTIVGNGITLNTSGTNTGQITLGPGIWHLRGQCTCSGFSTNPSSFAFGWVNLSNNQIIGVNAYNHKAGECVSYFAVGVVELTQSTTFELRFTERVAGSAPTSFESCRAVIKRLDINKPHKTFTWCWITSSFDIGAAGQKLYFEDNLIKKSTNIDFINSQKTINLPTGIWEVESYWTSGNSHIVVELFPSASGAGAAGRYFGTRANSTPSRTTAIQPTPCPRSYALFQVTSSLRMVLSASRFGTGADIFPSSSIFIRKIY